MSTKKLAILGSTGSIGTQALEVARAQGIGVCVLTANSNAKLLAQQAKIFKPETVCIGDETKADWLLKELSPLGTRVLSGKSGLVAAAADNTADTVLTAVVGISGLEPTVAAISQHKNIALANKETLVTAGAFVTEKVKENGVSLLPVDSEHSAIFQSLQGMDDRKELKRILLTASGGPFFGWKESELKGVTAAQALKHPNWSMGKKITIDSATMMNKGFEIIEAMWLFGVKLSDITVLVHRQSIVHSMVEYCDGAVIAQLGSPDMRLPIQYALTYPERKPCQARELDLFSCGELTFEKPDTSAFRCLEICRTAAEKDGLAPAALNAANEIAVELFLNGKIKFTDIASLASLAVERFGGEKYTLNDVLKTDLAVRESTRKAAQLYKIAEKQ